MRAQAIRNRHYCAKRLLVSRPIVCDRRLVPLVVLALAGCRRGPTAAAPDPLLARFPAETRVVASVDLARVRAAPLWARLAALAEEDPADRTRIQALASRTGLDPLRQIRRVVAAFPDSARQRGQFAVIIEGNGFDEKRLVAYAREEAAPRGIRIEAASRGRRTLWTASGPERTAGFFLGDDRFVLGGGGWAELMVDLANDRKAERQGAAAGPPSAAEAEELAHLCARIDRTRALWFAAIVPLDVRRVLLDDPRHDSAASVTRLAAAVDLGPGLTADLVADLSNAADARVLVDRIQVSVREAKRNAKVLMLGLAPYLDALSARAEGPSLRVRLALGEPQLRDLVDRLVGLLRVARAR
jgi:hypothetical protein